MRARQRQAAAPPQCEARSPCAGALALASCGVGFAGERRANHPSRRRASLILPPRKPASRDSGAALSRGAVLLVELVEVWVITLVPTIHEKLQERSVMLHTFDTSWRHRLTAAFTLTSYPVALASKLEKLGDSWQIV